MSPFGNKRLLVLKEVTGLEGAWRDAFIGLVHMQGKNSISRSSTIFQKIIWQNLAESGRIWPNTQGYASNDRPQRYHVFSGRKDSGV
jgi:hypothetical protein